MARVPSKHGRDQAMDFQGFLNDLQDWELNFKDKDKKMKAQTSNKTGEDKTSSEYTWRTNSSSSTMGKQDYAKKFDAIDRISSGLMAEENTVDATSEKELGNEYFKQKKFKEAIECYSRSIALSPSAVAYANRAMAYLKIRKFHEAEDDCTEALNLDDRYIKAYSRRATARKELKKFKESVEDSEFALRLEPNNQEIKKQYAEVKSLCEKEILEKATGSVRKSVEKLQKGNRGTQITEQEVKSDSRSTRKTSASTTQKGENKGSDEEALVKKSSPIVEITDRSSKSEHIAKGQQPNGFHNDSASSSAKSAQGYNKTTKQELKASIQELASRAASRAMAEAAKNIIPPKTAYQFELQWQGFSGDRTLQTRLLKVTPPSELPQIFKNALSAPILIDIIKTVASFFVDDMNLAVKYLENLTKVPRFDMLIMCLSPADKAEITKIWDEVFFTEATPIEYTQILDDLRSKYCLKL